MADIVFKYDEMTKAAEALDNLATDYVNAATKFDQDFMAAINEWEGESKDKMAAFISGPVRDYMASTVPEMLRGLESLLLYNVTQMQTADQQISDSIPTSLQ